MTTTCSVCGIADSSATCPRCEQRVCDRHMVLRVEELSVTEAARVGGLGTWVNTMRFVHPSGESFEAVPPGAYREGFVRGGPGCFSCRHADGEEHERTKPQREAQAASELARRLEALDRETSPSEVQRGLLDLSSSAPAERMARLWRRVAADPNSLPFAPTHDIVTVRRRRTRLGRVIWEEIARCPGWNVHVQRQVSLDASPEDHPGMGYHSSVVLDVEGTCWELSGLPHHASERDEYAVVRHGAPCAVSIQRRARRDPRVLVADSRWVRALDVPNDIDVALGDAIRCVLQNRPDSSGIENANS
jgi:cytochrome c553